MLKKIIVSKKLFFVSLMFVFVLISFVVIPRRTIFASAESYNLHIYFGPSRILADNTARNFFVQLEDSSGAPIHAPSDVTVLMSSSMTGIGTINSPIVITKGSLGNYVQFASTYTPGSTTITASASGYAPDEAVVTTVGAQPSTLAIYTLPPTLPADGNAYSAIILQLQDSNGYPAKAPLGNVQVTLFCSNTSVGIVDPTVVIASGMTVATATFRTVINAPGSAIVTAIASGYSSGQATISTQKPTAQPSRLKVYVGPSIGLADGGATEQAAVQLIDSNGTISQSASASTVFLTSSATDVGTIGSSVTISAGKTFSIVPITSTFKSGTTTITAAATNYASGQASLANVGSAPSKLAVFGIPSSLPANQTSTDALVVQLEDSLGNPAKQPSGQMVVNLFSSNPVVGNVNSTVTIPSGQTQVTGTIRTSLVAGSTTVTVQSSGYETGQTIITTYAIDGFPLGLSVTPNPATIINGRSLNITAHVTLPDNTPMLGANLQLTSADGGTSPQPIEQGNGYYLLVFTPPTVSTTTNFTVVITASKTGYTSASLPMQVTVTVFQVLVSATPDRISEGGTSNITAYVAYPDKTPGFGALVQFSSSAGGTFSAVADGGNGYYWSVFTAPGVPSFSTVNLTITSSATLLGAQNNASVLLTVISVQELQTGNIQFHVQAKDGTPVVQASITSISQPAGMTTLYDNTNQTGDALLIYVRSGSYIFQVAKVGYDTQTVSITLSSNQTATQTVTLASKTAPLFDQTMVISIATIVIVILVLVLIIVAFRRRAQKDEGSMRRVGD